MSVDGIVCNLQRTPGCGGLGEGGGGGRGKEEVTEMDSFPVEFVFRFSTQLTDLPVCLSACLPACLSVCIFTVSTEGPEYEYSGSEDEEEDMNEEEGEPR